MKKTLLLLVFCCICLYSQSLPDFYNLSFQNRQTFGWVVRDIFFRIDTDSAQLVNGKYPMCLRQSQFMEDPLPLSVELSRSMLLPETSGSRACIVSINSKCKNIAKAQVKVCTFDSAGVQVFRDSFDINSPNTWREVHKHLSVKGAKFLYLSIHASGSGPLPEAEQKMWIDRVGVRVDGFDMAGFNLDMLPPPQPIACAAVAPLLLKDEEAFASVDAFNTQKIIAVGESVHGAREFNRMALGIIKNQIIRNCCRLVALEIPSALGLKWNLYVQQEVSFDSSEIKNDLKGLRYSPGDMLNFLAWLKRYNANAPRKVRLFGMDANMLDGGTFEDCYSDYFYEHLSKDSSLFASLYVDNFYRKKADIIATIRQHPLIESYLGKKEVALLLKSLESPTVSVGLQNFVRFIIAGRDSIMFDNLSYAIAAELDIGETAVVYTHLLHAAKRNVADCVVPLGQHLCSAYGKDYFSVGLFAYEENEPCRESVDIPSPYSIEQRCKDMDVACFYALSSSISPNFVRVRKKKQALTAYNSLQINDFEFVPFRHSVDAFIYMDSVNMVDLKEKENTNNVNHKLHMLSKIRLEQDIVKALEGLKRSE
jgi:hypothetical protein